MRCKLQRTGKGTVRGGKATIASNARLRSPNDNATERIAHGMLPDRVSVTVKIDCMKPTLKRPQIWSFLLGRKGNFFASTTLTCDLSQPGLNHTDIHHECSETSKPTSSRSQGGSLIPEWGSKCGPTKKSTGTGIGETLPTPG